MTKSDQPRAVQFEDAEEACTNDSANPTFGDILAERFTRRDLMGGVLATTAMAAIASPAVLLTGCAEDTSPTPNFNFPEVAAGVHETHYVAEGYNAEILIRWGDKVSGDAPAFDVAKQSAEAQAKQFGYNNDFLGFIPIGGRADHGLLVVNHEYTNAELMFPGVDENANKDKRFAEMTLERTAVEMMAHGGSVIEVKRDGETWKVVAESKYARRITALTEMKMTGPAAGHGKMKTSGDPQGSKVVGMLNNCSGAVAPWGTWLSCEGNFNGYFWNKKAAGNSPHAVALQRYGAPAEWYN